MTKVLFYGINKFLHPASVSRLVAPNLRENIPQKPLHIRLSGHPHKSLAVEFPSYSLIEVSGKHGLTNPSGPNNCYNFQRFLFIIDQTLDELSRRAREQIGDLFVLCCWLMANGQISTVERGTMEVIPFVSLNCFFQMGAELGAHELIPVQMVLYVVGQLAHLLHPGPLFQRWLLQPRQLVEVAKNFFEAVFERALLELTEKGS